jgi:hypothetical protein
MMVSSDPLLLFLVCLVHETPDNQSRNARPDPIWYVTHPDNDIVQAVIVL